MPQTKKRKRREKTNCIHLRNKYSDNPPDFSLLSSLYPSFSPFVFYSSPHSRPRIDWTNFNATRELTRVLLHHDHNLNWWIPDGQLCPTVLNRSNYIHWIEDLLASSNLIGKKNVGDDKVKGFDIGTGANCIYPLLGASLLGWSFIGSDITDVALEWAGRNVKCNAHISDLIEIRKVCLSEPPGDGGLSDTWDEDDGQMKGVLAPVMKRLDEYAASDVNDKSVNELLMSSKDITVSSETMTDVTKIGPSTPFNVNSNMDSGYHGPPVLLGVVEEGEKFDFCMCNPPFFESMEESGLNPKTSCGGTPEEMVCPGGERAFITRMIEDSVMLKQSFWWFIWMVGKKSNLKVLISKLWEVGVTVVKITEFIQGQTCRWGLAWSFMPPAKKLALSNVVERSSISFALEGLQRQASAFNVLKSVESFFNHFGVSCKINPSSFTVDVSVSNGHCDVILKTDVKKFEVSSCLCEPEATNETSCSHEPIAFSFCVSVFQQIPGTLLVRGSLQQRDGSLSDRRVSKAKVFKREGA